MNNLTFPVQQDNIYLLSESDVESYLDPNAFTESVQNNIPPKTQHIQQQKQQQTLFQGYHLVSPTLSPESYIQLEKRNSFDIVSPDPTNTSPLITVDWGDLVAREVPPEIDSGASTPYSYHSGTTTPYSNYGSGASTPRSAYGSGASTPVPDSRVDHEVFTFGLIAVFYDRRMTEMLEDDFLLSVRNFHELIMSRLSLEKSESMCLRMISTMNEKRKDAVASLNEYKKQIEMMLRSPSANTLGVDTLSEIYDRQVRSEEAALRNFLIQHEALCVLELRQKERREEDLLRKHFQTFQLQGIGEKPEGVKKRKGSEVQRPRELPKGSTNILREWLAAHKDSPYPSLDEKQMFMEKTGLNMKQINTWFVNHRGRDLKEKKSSSKKSSTPSTPRAPVL